MKKNLDTLIDVLSLGRRLTGRIALHKFAQQWVRALCLYQYSPEPSRSLTDYPREMDGYLFFG